MRAKRRQRIQLICFGVERSFFSIPGTRKNRNNLIQEKPITFNVITKRSALKFHVGIHPPPSSIQIQKDAPSAIQKERERVLFETEQESLLKGNAKRDTAINPRTCYFCLYVLALIAVSRVVL